jgi:hypothetical protein
MANPTDLALTVAPTPDPTRVRAADGSVLAVPAGWALLPPGDAGLTRRVKAAGPAWTVVERKGNKNFSRGVWAPGAHIEVAPAHPGTKVSVAHVFVPVLVDQSAERAV